MFEVGQWPGMKNEVSRQEENFMKLFQTIPFGLLNHTPKKNIPFGQTLYKNQSQWGTFYLITREWINFPPEVLVLTTILLGRRRAVRSAIGLISLFGVANI